MKRSLLLACLVGGAACIERPTIVELPDIDFVSVAAGQSHTCGLDVTGAVYCWSRQDPVPSEVSDQITFASVATLRDHTCGVAVDGTGYCWGENLIGQLGVDTALTGQCRVLGFTETVPCATTPAEIRGNHTFAAIDVGSAHSCGLTTAGEVWCWGANGNGQLGGVPATTCDPSFLPDGTLCSFDPVRVDTNVTFTAVSTGMQHSCALDTAGNAWCWGSGDNGRLGTGNDDDQSTPAQVAGGQTWISIDAGGAHTCGVTSSGAAYCWGSNSDLQAGSGATDVACGIQLFRCLFAPRAVAGNFSFTEITTSDAVAIGGDGPLLGGHTCAVANTGDVYCWGLNTSGQLVNHNDLRSSSPVGISDEFTFASISAGQEHTCGITTGGLLKCWSFGGPVSRYYTFN